MRKLAICTMFIASVTVGCAVEDQPQTTFRTE